MLYLVQGETGQRLPPEYSVFARKPERQLLFLSFSGDAAEVALPDCGPNRACRLVRGRTIHFPRSALGDGRNMLYLIAREQEILQGWLFNYVVMLDDDEEFALRPHNTSMLGFDAMPEPIADYAQARGLKPAHVLHRKLSDFERWLRFMQPAVGSLCWGECGAEVSSRSICRDLFAEIICIE